MLITETEASSSQQEKSTSIRSIKVKRCTCRTQPPYRWLNMSCCWKRGSTARGDSLLISNTAFKGTFSQKCKAFYVAIFPWWIIKFTQQLIILGSQSACYLLNAGDYLFMTSTKSCLGFDEPLRFWLWPGISSRSPGTPSPRALKAFRNIKIYVWLRTCLFRSTVGKKDSVQWEHLSSFAAHQVNLHTGRWKHSENLKIMDWLRTCLFRRTIGKKTEYTENS